jgi:hypothetical protein
MQMTLLASCDPVRNPSAHSCCYAPDGLHAVGLRPKPRVKTSFLERCHLVVLLSILPCTVVWWPVYKSSTSGNLTLQDCAFLALWITSGSLFLGSKTDSPALARRSAAVCIFAVLAGCCSALSSVAFGRTEKLVIDLLHFMKQFGLPSIIPLSICLAARFRIRRLLMVCALLSTTFNVGIQLTGYQDRLPLFTHFYDLSAGQIFRPTGALSNPNDYSYICVAGLALAIASWIGAKGSSTLTRILCGAAISASLYGIVVAGSRSALAGLFCGAVYYMVRRRFSVAARVALVAASILVVTAGWQLSEVFRERLDAVLTQRSQEMNVESRIEAQAIAFRTWTAWPLGVGFSNMPEATTPYANGAEWVTAVQGSDSIYVNILLGAGIGGLAFLLLCFAGCWKLATSVPLGPRNGVLRSAIVSQLFCGLATMAPATIFVAPFFFTLVGLAALPERSRVAPR